MRTFDARAVAAVELPELEMFAVVLAEEADGSGQRLEITTALYCDEGDRRLGLDTYCLCTEAGLACYGGVTSWSLTPSSLEIRLDSRAAGELGAASFMVSFPPDSLQALSAGLARVLG